MKNKKEDERIADAQKRVHDEVTKLVVAPENRGAGQLMPAETERAAVELLRQVGQPEIGESTLPPTFPTIEHALEQVVADVRGREVAKTPAMAYSCVHERAQGKCGICWPA